ncbi:EAP30/Vps36 family-domain-containing protein [Cladochytrium replicatum]|nr:EAP30/Vps36 family-domain-containing protein [Cladochytrium replicatum]
MSRRGVGIAGLQRQAREREEFQRAGTALAAQQLEDLRVGLEQFKSNLEEFATKYRKDIKRDPQFRMHFQRMCSQIGVEPLASTKGFWAELLGIGDFYYELAIQIAQVSIATRERTGGLIDIRELKRLVEEMRGRNAQEISEDDIIRSIKAMKPLGNGFDIVSVGDRKMVQSVPRELNVDFAKVLSLAQVSGFVTAENLGKEMSWERERCERVLDALVKEGICWVDDQTFPDPVQYWIASFYSL